MAIPRAENGKHGQRTWSISKTFHHVTSEASTGVQNTAVGNGQTTKNHSLFGSSQALSLWQFRYISITVWHPCQIIAQIALVNHKCHEWHCFRNRLATQLLLLTYTSESIEPFGKAQKPSLSGTHTTFSGSWTKDNRNHLGIQKGAFHVHVAVSPQMLGFAYNVPGPFVSIYLNRSQWVYVFGATPRVIWGAYALAKLTQLYVHAQPNAINVHMGISKFQFQTSISNIYQFTQQSKFAKSFIPPNISKWFILFFQNSFQTNLIL